ncbi:MAG TPA: hypothetical protein VF913_16830 [Xanthobacteraceae bacterium]
MAMTPTPARVRPGAGFLMEMKMKMSADKMVMMTPHTFRALKWVLAEHEWADYGPRLKYFEEDDPIKARSFKRNWQVVGRWLDKQKELPSEMRAAT